jgi:DNA-binding NarL/FixJ family response regulator
MHPKGRFSERIGGVIDRPESEKMATDITIQIRDLTPFERLVLELLCEGKSNAAIARETAHTEKVVENTVSRSAKAFGIKSDGDTNVRVLLALAYRTHYGDKAWENLHLPCEHFEVGPDGQAICNRHV